MKEREQASAASQLARAIRERLSYANVVATAALFIALGGSAWAVAANSVGTKQLKNNAVSAKKIKKNAVNAQKIRKNAVRPKHIRAGSVRTPKIRDGAVTAEKLADGVSTSGPQGPEGPQGEVGPTFATSLGDAAVPVASPEHLGFPAFDGSFSLPSAGRVFVSASFQSLTVTCSAGDPRVGLYVDGEPFPGTERRLPSGTASNQLVITGISGPLSAGSHNLSAGFDCPDGPFSSAGAVTPSVNVILIGA